MIDPGKIIHHHNEDMKRSRSSSNNTNTNINASSFSPRPRIADADSSIDDMIRNHGYDIVSAILEEINFQNQHPQQQQVSLAAFLGHVKKCVVNGHGALNIRDESIVQAFVYLMANSMTSVDGLIAVIRRRVLARYPSRLGQPLPRWAVANVSQARSR
jgi:hypothetical protein